MKAMLLSFIGDKIAKSKLFTSKNQTSAGQPAASDNPPFLHVLKNSMLFTQKTEGLSDATIEKYGFMLTNIQRAFSALGLSNLTIKDVRVRHMEELRVWLRESLKLPNGKRISIDHCNRHLRHCRSACHYAVNQEYISHNPLTSLRMKKLPPKPIVSCTPEDLERIESYESKLILQRNVIRDLFLYQCFTGLSYMDIWRHEIVNERYLDKEGLVRNRQLVTSKNGRGKNRRMYWAPYIEKAREIRERYNGDFPRVSNQTYNRSIKKIVKEAGVNLVLTSHVGRKTFATVLRIKGMSMPAIAVALGNTEEVCRNSYAGGSKEMIMEELSRLESEGQIIPAQSPRPTTCNPVPLTIQKIQS